MENPYQSPQDLVGQAATPARGSMARQIPVVAILLMVQGGLEMLMGGMLWFIATFVGFAAGQQAARANPKLPFAPQTAGWIIVGLYVLLGLGVLAAAALKFFAGWRNYSFRGKNWGIAALASSVISIFTCYCFPTALALMIYGLIVYGSADAGWAFDMGAQGSTRDQILGQLYRDAG